LLPKRVNTISIEEEASSLKQTLSKLVQVGNAYIICRTKEGLGKVGVLANSECGVLRRTKSSFVENSHLPIVFAYSLFMKACKGGQFFFSPETCPLAPTPLRYPVPVATCLFSLNTTSLSCSAQPSPSSLVKH